MKRNFPLLLCLLCISCVSLRIEEPADNNSSLAVGEIILKAERFEKFGDATVNGIHSGKIRMTFLELNSYQSTVVESAPGSGLFYFPVIADGKYQLTNVFYKIKGSNGSWADLHTAPMGIIFETRQGKIYNLGHLEWKANADRVEYTVKQNRNPDSVRADFIKEFEESQWNQFPWENILFDSTE